MKRLLIQLIFLSFEAACVQVQIRGNKREQDHEAWVTMHTLISSENTYFERARRYSGKFNELILPKPLSLNLKSSEGCISGYCYRLSLSSDGYTIVGWPQYWEKSGYRSFYADQTGLMRFTLEPRVATASDEQDWGGKGR